MNRISIEIDEASCNGCKICVHSCFVDVLRWDDNAGTPLVAYPEDCVWCLACEDACPAQCIEVIPAFPYIEPAAY
jgi:NAD-dependent dihydropyrimidine dehydrogenase PreA subunit